MDMYLQSFDELPSVPYDPINNNNGYIEIIDELVPTPLNVMEGYAAYSTLL